MVHLSRIMQDDRPDPPPAATDPRSPGPGTAPPPPPARGGPIPGWVPPGPAGPAGPPSSRGRVVILLVAGLVVAIMAFSMGISVGAAVEQGGPTPSYAPASGRPDWALLDDAWTLLDEHYVDPSALDPLALERGAVSGMAASLDDRGHTGYLTPQEVKDRDESLSGTFVGIGAILDDRDGAIVIVRVLRDSPAERAGVKAGDRIVSVDGSGVEGQSVSDIAGRVRGPEGTRVTLELRDLGGATRTVTITRAKLELPVASWAFAPGTRSAVLRVESFSSGAAKAATAAISEAMDQGATGLVIDLRGNPGGYVNEPVELASQFLASGVVYVSVDRTGKQTDHDVEGRGVALDLPLVLLVDGQTASSAEIFTGAIQDAGRARVVGVRTYGTGTVVTTYPLPDGGALTIGTERWLTPKGRAIWREGLLPDEVVELPTGAPLVVPDDFATLGAGGVGGSGDSQLIAALAALRGEEPAGRAAPPGLVRAA